MIMFAMIDFLRHFHENALAYILGSNVLTLSPRELLFCTIRLDRYVVTAAVRAFLSGELGEFCMALFANDHELIPLIRSLAPIDRQRLMQGSQSVMSTLKREKIRFATLLFMKTRFIFMRIPLVVSPSSEESSIISPDNIIETCLCSQLLLGLPVHTHAV